MYGTIARLQVRDGMLEALREYANGNEVDVPGMVFQYAYLSDANPNDVWLVVGFESREAYEANASSPEQHERFSRMMEYLAAAPEWHDGTVVDAWTRASDGSVELAQV